MSQPANSRQQKIRFRGRWSLILFIAFIASATTTVVIIRFVARLLQ